MCRRTFTGYLRILNAPLTAMAVLVFVPSFSWAETFENSEHQMAAGNFDSGDAANEVVYIQAVNNWGAATTAGNLFVHDFNGGFSQTLPGITAIKVVAGDVTGDGRDEVVYINSANQIGYYDFATNTNTIVDTTPIGGVGAQDITVANIDGDAQLEIYLSQDNTGNGALRFYDAVTDTFTGANGGAGNIIRGEFDGDAVDEVAVRNGPNNGSGALFVNQNPPGAGFNAFGGGLNRIAAGDLDGGSGDATDEILLTNSANSIFTHGIFGPNNFYRQTGSAGTDPTIGHPETFGDGRDLAYIVDGGGNIIQGVTTWDLGNSGTLSFTALRQVASNNASAAVGNNGDFFDILAADITNNGLDAIIGRKTADGGTGLYVFENGGTTLALAAVPNIFLTATDAINTSSLNSAGNWSNNQAPQSGLNYEVTGAALRTPTGNSAHTFNGDSLTIGAGGTLAFKSRGNITINDLILDGGSISHWSVGGDQIADLFGNINVVSDSQLMATGGGTRRLHINSTVVGSTNLLVTTDSDGDRVEFFGNMSGYSGDITVNGRADIFNSSLGSGTVFVNGLLRSSNTTSANGYIAGTIAGDIQVNDGGQAFIQIPTATGGGGPYVIAQQFTIDGDAANSADNSQIHYDPAGATVNGSRRVDLTDVRLAANAIAGIRNNEGSGGNVGLTLLGDATITADGEADIFDLLNVDSSGGAHTLTIGQTETFNTQLLGTSDANTTLTLANANLTMDPVGTGADLDGSVNVNSGSSMTVTSDWTFDGGSVNVNSGAIFTGESVTVDGATFDVSGGLANIQSFHLDNGAQGGVSNGGTLNVLGNTTTVNGGSTLFITGGSDFNEAMDLIVADGAGETGFVDQNTGGNADIDGSVIVGRDGGVGDWTAAAGSGTVDIGSGAGSIFDIGRTNVAGVAGTSGNVNLSGASSVTIDVSELRIGTLPGSANPGSNALGVLTLSDTGTNTIDASTQIIVGDSPGSGNVGGHQLNFGGATNDVNTPLLTIAGRKSSASASIETGGTLNLNGAGGVGRAELRIGFNNTGTGANVTGNMDLSDATFNANISTLAIGRHDSGSGSGSGTLTFDAGTVNVNDVILGEASAGAVDGSSNPQNTVGNVVQNGGDFIVNDSMTLGLNGAVGNYTASGGTVSVGSGGGSDNLFVGRRDQNAGGVNAAVVSTMDLSGASQFTFDGNQIGIGTVSGGGGGQTRPGGNLLLADTNNITANSILIADSPSVGLGGHTNLLELGTTNTIAADTITVGGSKGSALLNFRSPGSTLALNSAGSRGDLFIGNQVVGTGGGSNGTVNFLDSTVNAFLDELVVGRKPNNASGNTNGTLSFNSGTIDVNSVQLGVRTNAGNAGNVTGTINQSGGTMIVNGNMELGVDGGNDGNFGVGNYNLSAGTLSFNDTSGTTQTPIAPASTLFVNDGSTFNFSGGTLENVTTIDVALSNSSFTVGNDAGSEAIFVIGSNGVSDPANAVLPITTIQSACGGSGAIDFLLNTDGTLAIDIFGPGSHGGSGEAGGVLTIDPLSSDLDSDLLHVSGNATLDGTLAINLNGYEPAPFHWYDVLLADGGDINIDNLTLDGVNFVRVVDDPTDPTGIRQLLQVAVPEPASILIWGLLGLAGVITFWRRSSLRA